MIGNPWRWAWVWIALAATALLLVRQRPGEGALAPAPIEINRLALREAVEPSALALASELSSPAFASGAAARDHQGRDPPE